MTKIEWTDATWNPIAGCSDVSEGCRHCYARTMAGRLEAIGQAKYAGLTVLQGSKRVWTGKISFDEKALLAPLRRKKPTRYFVNSMSDLFHPNVTDAMRDRIFAVMALCPQHTFQVLTKRPEAMPGYLCSGKQSPILDAGSLAIPDVDPRANPGARTRIAWQLQKLVPVSEWGKGNVAWPLPNVWLGVSVEDQKTADARLDYLCEIASQGWQTMVSFEPLLSAVDPGPWWLSLGARTWAIVGGESGVGARPMHPDWARSLRDQCKAARVPFFFKQWGDLAPGAQGANYVSAKRTYTRIDIHGKPSNDPTSWAVTDALFYRVGKKAAGALLDGVPYREMP